MRKRGLFIWTSLFYFQIIKNGTFRLRFSSYIRAAASMIKRGLS
ncbi:hypothetical protein CHCC14814_3820 [Bacillus paralicheniformis]|nr:hypothetical protein CHCC14814_3820 [Bacillus paralicheniformis]